MPCFFLLELTLPLVCLTRNISVAGTFLDGKHSSVQDTGGTAYPETRGQKDKGQ